MSSKISWLLILMLSATILTGCKFYDPEIRGVSTFAKQEGTPKGTLAYDIGVRVYNPNKFRIVLKHYNLEFYLNGKSVGNAQSREKNKMPGRKESDVVLSVQTTPGKLTSSLLLMGLTGALNGGEFKVKVQGSARARAFGIGKTFVVDYEEGMDLNLDELIK